MLRSSGALGDSPQTPMEHEFAGPETALECDNANGDQEHPLDDVHGHATPNPTAATNIPATSDRNCRARRSDGPCAWRARVSGVMRVGYLRRHRPRDWSKCTPLWCT